MGVLNAQRIRFDDRQFSRVRIVRHGCLIVPLHQVPTPLSLQTGFVSALIANGSIAGQPAFVHPRQDRNPPVHIVVDPHLGLRRMQSMQPTCVLHDGAPPRDRHGQEQGVQSRVVEALADVPPCGENQKLLTIGDGGQRRQRLSALLRADTPPPTCSTIRCRVNARRRPARKSRWSFRSVSTSGEGPASSAPMTSFKIRSFRRSSPASER